MLLKDDAGVPSGVLRHQLTHTARSRDVVECVVLQKVIVQSEMGPNCQPQLCTTCHVVGAHHCPALHCTLGSYCC